MRGSFAISASRGRTLPELRGLSVDSQAELHYSSLHKSAGESYGTRIRPAQGVTCASAHAGVIISVGAEAYEAASYASQIRGWPQITILNLPAVADFIAGRTGMALVVTDLADVRSGDLLAVTRRAGLSAPELALGFLYGRGGAQLLAAARKLAPVPTIGVHPGRQVALDGTGMGFTGANLVEAGKLPESSAGFGTLLLEPAEVLYVMGHSNGVDIGMAPGLALCNRSGTEVGAELRVLPCFHGDVCRRGRAVEDAARSVRATRIIDLSCMGVCLAGSAFAQEFSIADALMRGPEVQSLICTTRVMALNSAEPILMYHLVNAGLPMGAVANHANRYRLWRGDEADFVCFGDPASRIDSSVVSCPAGWIGNRSTLHLTLGESRQAMCDICIEVPPEIVPRLPVCVTFGTARVMSAVFDPVSSPPLVRATVATPSEGTTLELRLAACNELPLIDSLPVQLLQDLRFLAIYAAGALRANVSPALDGVAVRMVNDLAHAIENWPLAGLAPGAWLEAAKSDELETTLKGNLMKLAGIFVAQYSELVRSQGTQYTTALWVGTFGHGTEARRPNPCAYCGQPLDIWTRQPRLQNGPTRRVCYCQGCGFVCDGDPEFVAWIDSPSEVRPGADVVCHLRTANPYRFPLPLRGAVVFEDFARRETLASAIIEPSVPENGTRLEVQITVPEGVFPGIHSIGAIVMLGAKVNFLRRLVIVNPNLGR